jgi:hypothetical protein
MSAGLLMSGLFSFVEFVVASVAGLPTAKVSDPAVLPPSVTVNKSICPVPSPNCSTPARKSVVAAAGALGATRSVELFAEATPAAALGSLAVDDSAFVVTAGAVATFTVFTVSLAAVKEAIEASKPLTPRRAKAMTTRTEAKARFVLTSSIAPARKNHGWTTENEILVFEKRTPRLIST